MATPTPATPRYFAWSRHRWQFGRWAQASGIGLPDADSERLARTLAAHAVDHRLQGAAQLWEAWVRVATGGAPYSDIERDALRAFLIPFAPTRPPDHRQGAVAEYLWHLLSLEDTGEPALVRISGPKMYATGPGGDGLTVRRDGDLVFTLWEIKKHTGTRLASVIRGACKQLSLNAAQYLTEHAATGQLSADPEEARLFARIVEAWVGGEPSARAGVAVTTTAPQERCFTRMHRHFPQLQGDHPCSGLLSVLDGFPRFTDRVAEIAWTGL